MTKNIIALFHDYVCFHSLLAVERICGVHFGSTSLSRRKFKKCYNDYLRQHLERRYDRHLRFNCPQKCICYLPFYNFSLACPLAGTMT